MEKRELVGLKQQDFCAIAQECQQPNFKGDQLYSWIYKKSAPSFEVMSNLSKEFRKYLEEHFVITHTKIQQRQISRDGTIKYLLELADGCLVETVLMRFDNRPNLTVCLSTQVGCAVDCSFCATGKLGFTRNLTTAEIVDQILTIQRDTGLNVTNVVYMGQGEPLNNYYHLVESIDILNRDLDIGMRRITVSTSGIVSKIYALAEVGKQFTLAVSLHAPNDDLRDTLVPINKKMPLQDLMKAVRYYVDKVGRRVTIEYVMLKGINDDLKLAKELGDLLRGLHCNINLIPYNATCGHYRSTDEKQINLFKYILEETGKKVTVRLKRGNDIQAACGQLANNGMI